MDSYDKAEELRNLVSEAKPEQIEAVMEYLHDKDLLRPEAKNIRKAFNLKYLQENKCEGCGNIEKDVIPVGDGRPDRFQWMCKDCRTMPEYMKTPPNKEKGSKQVKLK